MKERWTELPECGNIRLRQRPQPTYWQRHKRTLLKVLTAAAGVAGIVLLFRVEQDPRWGLAAIPLLVGALIAQSWAKD